MFRKTISYRLLIMLLLFSLALILPVLAKVLAKSRELLETMNSIQPLVSGQLEAFDHFTNSIRDSFISISFYVFFLAFIITLFFSRKLLSPIRELMRGARSIMDGKLDINLDVSGRDELADVTRAFNEMAKGLNEKTKELERKNLYISTMIDPIIVVDMDNIVTDINPAFTKLFGYERQDVLGSSIFDFLDEENSLIMRRQLYSRDQGRSSTYSISFISTKGELIPVLISGSPILSDEGDIEAKIGIMKDFRNELALRNALKEAVDYRETIMDSMVDPLVVIDRDYRIVLANKAAFMEAGEDIIGKSCHTILHGMPEKCSPHGMDCPAYQVFTTGNSYRTVHEHLAGKGEKVYHEVVAYPVIDDKGNVRHVVETRRDVTDKVRYEENTERRNRELSALNSIAMIMNQSLNAEDIFNGVLDKIVELMEMDGGGIYFTDETGRELTCRFHRGLSEEFVSRITRLRTGEDVPGRVAATGQIFATSDIARDTRLEKSVFRHSGLKAFVCFPIKGKERPLGVFYIFSLNPHIFIQEEERIFLSIGEMVGMAFENIRLYESVKDLFEKQRLRKAEEQRALLSLSSLLASVYDMREVLDSALSMIKNSFRADFVWLLQEDDSGNLVMASSTDRHFERASVIYPPGTSSVERYALNKKEPLIIGSLADDSRFFISDELGSMNFVSALSLPVYAGSSSIGAITLYYNTLKEPRDEDIYFLQTVASMLYVSIERFHLKERTDMERGKAETVLESIVDGIITVNSSGKVITANRSASDIIGVPPEALEGGPLVRLISYSEENAALSAFLEKSLEKALQGEIYSGEGELLTPDRRYIPLYVGSAPVRDLRGGVLGAVYVLRDLSREREIDSLKRDFVRAVSHEFRTPLSAIVGMTEMLLSSDVSGERATEYLKTILNEGSRLSVMVNDLLDVAKIEGGKEMLHDEEIDFSALVESVRKEYEQRIQDKEAEFIVKIDGDLSGFTGDAEKLTRMIRNLVDNSLLYSDKGCSIEIDIRRENALVRIEVKDTGWGISQDDLKHMGEKFYRGVHGKKVKGTGLGLSLAREIARMHGGSLNIRSKSGEGTTAIVLIPIRRSK